MVACFVSESFQSFSRLPFTNFLNVRRHLMFPDFDPVRKEGLVQVLVVAVAATIITASALITAQHCGLEFKPEEIRQFAKSFCRISHHIFKPNKFVPTAVTAATSMEQHILRVPNAWETVVNVWRSPRHALDRQNNIADISNNMNYFNFFRGENFGFPKHPDLFEIVRRFIA